MTDFTLSQCLQEACQRLGVWNMSKVDATSTATTVVDSKQQGKWANNLWKDGALFIVSDAAGVAPEGEFNRISLFNNSTYTFTVDTAFTAAPAAGDVYGFTDDTFPLLQLIEFVNTGLRSLDMLDLTDITTITITADQKEYAGAVAWKRSKPWLIERATSTDTNAYGWKEVSDWDYNSAAAGSTPLILFKQQYDTANSTIKVHYKDLHPTIRVFSDKIREEVHPDLAVAATVAKAVEWYVGTQARQDPIMNQWLSDVRVEYDRALVRHPVVRSAERLPAKTIELVFNRP
jgi:hypothetical protein